MRGEGEGMDVVDNLVQRVDQEQEEIRDLRDRARNVAECHDLRSVAMLALPGREKGDAAPRGIAAQRAADVEMTAPLALAWFRIALAQAPCDLADESAHLRDMAPFDAGERGVAQNLVAQVFSLLPGIERKPLRDGVANGVAQAIERGAKPLGQCRIGRGQLVEIVA